MTYVDLNTIRAKIAMTLQTIDFTSVREHLASDAERRLGRKTAKTTKDNAHPNVPRVTLLPFLARPTTTDRTVSAPGASGTHHLLCIFSAYVERVDWTGRSIRKNKRGTIPHNVANTLERREVDPTYWVKTVKTFHCCYPNAAGPAEKLQGWAENLNQLRVRGIRHAMRLYRVVAP